LNSKLQYLSAESIDLPWSCLHLLS